MHVFAKIRKIVHQIPAGKVSTYGHIAKIVHTVPRVVGWALRGNESVHLPCHRIVKTGGWLADNFSLGNWPEQRRRLQSEGVQFDGKKILDFEKCLYKFP